MNDYPAYEVHGHRDNGEVFGVAVLGRLPDTEALGFAQQYADRWHASVSLCRVPFVDQGQVARRVRRDIVQRLGVASVDPAR
jgi:hypothetical protein